MASSSSPALGATGARSTTTAGGTPHSTSATSAVPSPPPRGLQGAPLPSSDLLLAKAQALELRTAVRSLQEQVGVRDQQLANREREMRDMEDELDRAQEQHLALSRQLEQRDRDARQLEQELAESALEQGRLQSSLSWSELEVGQLKQEVERLKQSLDSTSSSSSSSSRGAASAASLHAVVSTVQNQLLRSHLDRAASRLEELQSRPIVEEAHTRALETRVKALERSLIESTRRATQKVKEAAELQEQMSSRQRATEAGAAKMRVMESKLRAALSRAMEAEEELKQAQERALAAEEGTRSLRTEVEEFARETPAPSLGMKSPSTFSSTGTAPGTSSGVHGMRRYATEGFAAAEAGGSRQSRVGHTTPSSSSELQQGLSGQGRPVCSPSRPSQSSQFATAVGERAEEKSSLVQDCSVRTEFGKLRQALNPQLSRLSLG